MKLFIMAMLSVLGFTLLGTQTVDAASKALVVVSFGSTFKETREADIGGIEKALIAAFPDREFRRAFTSKIVMKRLLENDNIKVDDLETTLEKLQKEGYKDILIQPTHLLPGEEIDNKVIPVINKYKNKFTKVSFGKPLLSAKEDLAQVAKALETTMPQLAKDEMVVYMGHGSPNRINFSYTALEETFQKLNIPAIIGVVEENDYPNYEDMLSTLKKSGAKKVFLMPLMIVAGDHANNDMAGDEDDSWSSMLKKEGFEVRFALKGIGKNTAIQSIYVYHALEALTK